MNDPSPTTLSQSFLTGAVVGFTEVFLTHPCWTAKTRQQCGLPFTLNPRVLWRGAIPEAAAMIPIDIIQMALSTAINERFLHNRGDTSISKRALAGFAGGAVGGLGISVVEAVMTHQQLDRVPRNFFSTAYKMFRVAGASSVFTGTLEASLRNGIYNTGFFAAAPLLNRRIEPSLSNPVFSVLVSGAVAGGVVSVLSHPLDAIKTRRQKEGAIAGIRKTAVSMYREGGVNRFFVGLGFRSARVILGMMGTTFVYERLEKDKFRVESSK